MAHLKEDMSVFGLLRGAREGLDGSSEGGYVGLWNEI